MIRKYIFVLCLWCSAAAAGLSSRFPDAAVILLHDRENTIYQSDGTSETRDLCRYRIMNYDGVLQMRTLNMHYNSTYGTLQISALSITKKDGREIKLDPAQLSRTGIDPEQMQSRIYDPAQKCLTVTVPNLEAGDTLTVESLRRTLKPRIPGEWSDICVMQADFPILDYQYTVDAPAEKPLRSIAVKDEVKGTLSFKEEKINDRIRYSWHARNVPQAFPEPAMPQLYSCSQRVLVSTVKDWQTISRWYAELCAPQLAKVNAAMQEKTAALTTGKKDEMAKINALFQFVSQQIRYTGITDEKHAPGYEPHAVDQTFDRRHGVCRDKAALLVAMLRLAGIEAYPVLFMSGTPKDREVPNIYFNHAVVAAVVNGEYVLMDPTFETTRELFPSYLAGDAFLVAKPAGDTLRTAPAIPAEKNLLTVSTDGKVDSKNVFSGEITLNFSGIYDQMYRSAFSEWTPREREEYFAVRLQKNIPGMKIRSFAVTPENVRDMSEPLTVKISVSTENTICAKSAVRFFTPPRLARTLGMLDTLYTMTALQKRNFPLRALPRAVKENIRITLPQSFRIASLPDDVSCGVENIFRFSSGSSHEKNILTENRFYAVDSMLIPPEKYPELKQALAIADRAETTLPLLEPGMDLLHADSLLLEHEERLMFHSFYHLEHITRVRRKIFNYDGMSEFSELRVPYLDGIDSVDISGKVTSPDGTSRTLSAGELNRMDFPGAAAMPRYPRRKIAVASFPNVIPGSVVEYTVKRHFRNRAWLAITIPMQNHTPTGKRMITVAGKVPVNINFSGNMNCRRQTVDGKTVFSAADIPALPREKGAPPLEFFVPRVTAMPQIDRAELRQAISRRLQKKVAAASPEISELAKKIAGNKTGLSAIEAIHQYVSTFIREADHPFFLQWAGKFSVPEQSLKDGYASSADRAILLAAMLDAIGIKSEFALATDHPVPENESADELVHDYALAVLYLPEYKIFLNDQGLYGTLGSRRNSDGRVMLLTERDIPRQKGDALDVSAGVKLDDSGNAAIIMEYRFRGKYFETEAERFAKFTPEFRKRHFQSLAASISPGAKNISGTAAGSKDLFTVKVQFYVPGFARRTGRYASCEVPGYEFLRNIYTGITPQKRDLPFFMAAHDVSLKYTVAVPEKWKCVSGGMNGNFTGGNYSGQINISGGNRLLSPAEYAAEAEKAQQINRAESGKILFITE